MRALHKVGDLATVSVDGTFHTGRISSLNARVVALVLATGETVIRPRRELKAVRPGRKSLLLKRKRATRQEPKASWEHGPGHRHRVWKRPLG